MIEQIIKWIVIVFMGLAFLFDILCFGYIIGEADEQSEKDKNLHKRY